MTAVLTSEVAAAGLPVKQLIYRVRYISPFLMNAPTAMLRTRETGKKGSKANAIPSPAEEARDGLYITEEGRIYVPAAAFRNCMLMAARDFKFKAGGRGRPTSLARILQGTLFAVGERVELDDGAGIALTDQDYEVSAMRAVPPGRGAVIRGRPMFRKWGGEVTWEYLTEYLNEDVEDQISDAFRRGGVLVGVGNFRPQLGGPFGRFSVERIA